MRHPNQDIFRALKKVGWEVTYRRGGHVCLKSPNLNMPLVFTPSTPTRDPRARLNLLSQLRRCGFIWQGR